ncbi:hypothetical protein C8R45DRAFT_929068 [Mycena sanguinolenta]|nr:hypothetical protein C8R45DRAFT_929068 [Mycena sanguinolenta]
MFSVLAFSYQQCSLLLCTSNAINLFAQQPYESSDGLFALSHTTQLQLCIGLWIITVALVPTDFAPEPSLNFTVNSGAEHQVCDTTFAFISFAIKRDGWDYFFDFLPHLVYDWGVEKSGIFVDELNPGLSQTVGNPKK